MTEHYVRHQGIHPKAAEELAAALPKPTTPAAKRLRKQLLEFVQDQARQARDEERLLGSSEVLESIIGKFKNVAGERGQHGLTGMVLSIGALVGKQTVATVENGPDRDPNAPSLELVSLASRPHRPKRPRENPTSTQPGTKTETITPQKRLILSPAQVYGAGCACLLPCEQNGASQR